MSLQLRTLLLRSLEAAEVVEDCPLILTSQYGWKFILYLVINAFVGYITNVIAIWMMFYPTNFWGVEWWRIAGQPWGLFGWQGIIPMRAADLADTVVSLTINKLIMLKDVFNRIEPESLALSAASTLEETVHDGVDRVAMQTFPNVWSALPIDVQEDLRSVVEIDCQLFLKILLGGIRDNIDEILDIRGMIRGKAEEHRELMAEIFLGVGGQEILFIKRSGFIFGAILGAIQLSIFEALAQTNVANCNKHLSALLILFGLIVGFVTNYIALTLIFEPARPIKTPFYTIQGLFLKRQKEAASAMAKLSTQHFLRADYFFQNMTQGSYQDNFYAVVQDCTVEYMRQAHGQQHGVLMNIIDVIGDTSAIDFITRTVADLVLDNMEEVAGLMIHSLTQQLDLQTELDTKLQSLPPEEFIGVLRPAFKQDELKLIVIGALLGAIAGALQYGLNLLTYNS